MHCGHKDGVKETKIGLSSSDVQCSLMHHEDGYFSDNNFQNNANKWQLKSCNIMT